MRLDLPSGLVVRGFTPPLRLADFRLAAFDMDSTLINIECIDEIAAAVGLKAEVAAITEATMRGEIADFKESLRRRVALLKGVHEKCAARDLGTPAAAQPRRRDLPGGAARRRPEDAAGLRRLHVLQRPRGRGAWPSTTRAPTCWRSSTARSPAASSRSPGATSATARKSSACCCRPARRWASRPRRRSRWATARTTCR